MTPYVLMLGVLVGSVACSVSALAQQTSSPTTLYDSASADQIAAGRENVSIQQVSGGSHLPSLEATSQITNAGDRITQPPPSGSSRTDARPVASVAVGGSDRCDQKSRDVGKVAVCATPIETRGAEFDRPSSTLSPEQRLAITREMGNASETTKESTRLGRGADPEAITSTDQGIAALTLAKAASATSSMPNDASAPAAVDPAVVDAIIQIIGQPASSPR